MSYRSQHRLFGPLACLACTLSLAVGDQPDSEPVPSRVAWTSWRGSDRDGNVSHYATPGEWPAELEPSWRVDVGVGYGSPLVADGRVFQHSRQGEDEVIVCLDLATGGAIWRQSEPLPFTMGNGGERHGKGPKSTPALADGRIFTMSITGVLTAWDATSGERLWQRSYDDEFGKSHPYWGMATSPMAVGDRVIAHFGTDDKGVLVALDAMTGEEVWRHGSDGASYSSPIVAEIEGVCQVIEWNHRALVAVECDTGRFLWEFPFPHDGPNQNMPTPLFYNGRVLLGGENRGLHGLKPIRSGDSWSVEPLWHQSKVALDMSSAVVNGGFLFGFSHYKRGQLFCLDPTDGSVQWFGPGRTGDNVMFLSTPHHVVALLDQGELQVIAPRDDQYETVARYRVAEGDTWAPPVLLPNAILIKGLTHLTRWTIPE